MHTTTTQTHTHTYRAQAQVNHQQLQQQRQEVYEQHTLNSTDSNSSILFYKKKIDCESFALPHRFIC